MAQEAQPVTAADIVDAIRRRDEFDQLIDRDAAVALIEMYAAIVANEAAFKAARKATTESFDACIAITDEALSKPLERDSDVRELNEEIERMRATISARIPHPSNHS